MRSPNYFYRVKILCWAIAVMVPTISFTSCEQSPTADSSIKGIWEYQQNQGKQTLEFGAKDVKYSIYADFYNINATYSGTYTINNQTITLKFTSLTSTRTSKPKVEYMEPEKMPTEAVLKGNNTIIYLDYTFTRK